jgi:hypothetical protein
MVEYDIDHNGEISLSEFKMIIKDIMDSEMNKRFVEQQMTKSFHGLNAQKLDRVNLTDEHILESMIRAEGPCYVHHPSGSTWVKCWDIVQTMLLLYIAVMVPWDFANFSTAVPVSPRRTETDMYWGNVWFWIDFVAFILFTMDIFKTFFTSIQDEQGNLVTETRRIARTYIFGKPGSRVPGGWFVLDAISVLPDLLVYLPMVLELASTGTTGDLSTAPTGDIVRASKLVTKSGRFTKLLKLSRVARIAQKLQKYGHKLTTIMKAAVMLFALIWMLHFFTCLWFMVGDSVEECKATGLNNCSREEGYFRNGEHSSQFA